MITPHELSALKKARLELVAAEAIPSDKRQLIKRIQMRIDRLEDQHHSKRWYDDVEFQDMPVGQIFTFIRTTHKSDQCLEIQPKTHHAMKSQGCAIIISKGMDQGSLINLDPRRKVRTKGR